MKKALLIIDLQNDYFPQGKFPLWNTEVTLNNILEAAPDAPVVIKTYADGFVKTNLNEVLENLDVDELLVCGMMTQNCVTHTSISNKKSKNYKTSILMDACTSVSEPIHLIALAATLTWDVSLISYKDI